MLPWEFLGAVHHIVGMNCSGTVIAVNQDPKAPIFRYADYGICCDINEFCRYTLNMIDAAENNRRYYCMPAIAGRWRKKMKNGMFLITHDPENGNDPLDRKSTG